jgi:lipopolysaccharide transport system ATP-binding protein
MSADTVIKVEDLSKLYMLGQTLQPYGTLRHAIQNVATAPLRWMKAARRNKDEPNSAEFWALKDVSFTVNRGDVVGILGRNGAGKSTLLKILSRITEPTTGRIGVKGRVASLLEVGTGFHPELTGRENIYLNGAILGMTRAEIRRKFDEIVAFAGIERFLDTPVKRYSSGMYVRLAFAVAAHLEPEILIVDEVLAVGDSEFQKKCIGKMKEVTAEGRTVLFVSHNLPAVAALCRKGILLKEGRLILADTVENTIAQYKKEGMSAEDSGQAIEMTARSGTGTHRLEYVKPGVEEFPARTPMRFRAGIKQFREDAPFHYSLHFRNEADEEIFAINSEYLDGGSIPPGNREVEVVIESPWLPPGDYRVEAFLHSAGIIDHWPDACRFQVGSDVATLGYSLSSAKNAGKVLAAFRMNPQAGPEV